MKKLILLLFIPLVFACSSDSSNDNNTIETPIKEFMMSNVFYYAYMTADPSNPEGPQIVDYHTYHIFDFQTEPFNRLTRKFWFDRFPTANPICDWDDPQTWNDAYLCTDLLASANIQISESNGGIIYETEDTLVWQVDFESWESPINVEFKIIDNQTISWKHFGGDYFEAEYSFWEDTLSVVDEQELIDRLEYVNYTAANLCSTCTY